VRYTTSHRGRPALPRSHIKANITRRGQVQFFLIFYFTPWRSINTRTLKRTDAEYCHPMAQQPWEHQQFPYVQQPPQPPAFTGNITIHVFYSNTLYYNLHSLLLTRYILGYQHPMAVGPSTSTPLHTGASGSVRPGKKTNIATYNKVFHPIL